MGNCVNKGKSTDTAGDNKDVNSDPRTSIQYKPGEDVISQARTSLKHRGSSDPVPTTPDHINISFPPASPTESKLTLLHYGMYQR